MSSTEGESSSLNGVGHGLENETNVVTNPNDECPTDENERPSSPLLEDPELEALLDDAIKDFDNPFKYIKKQPNGTGNAEVMMDSVWAEEFIKQATSQFEEKMREYLKSSLKEGNITKKQQQTLEKNMSKIVDAASTAALKTTTDPETLSAQLNEAIRSTAKKVVEMPVPASVTNTHLPNLNTAGLPDEAEFARMMGGLGGMSLSDDDNFDDSEMNEILPFMTNMMQKLLSKELLQPVLTDIVNKYPEWLSSNRETLSSRDYDKYSQQHLYMKQICEEYAAEKDSDSEDVKKKRFEKISDLMLKVQYAGPPPQELIGEVEGGNALPSFGPAGGDQCSVM